MKLNRLSQITTADGHVQRNRYYAEGLRHEMEEDGRLVQFIYNHRGEVISEESREAGLIRYIRGLGIVSSDSEQAKTYYHYVCDYAGSTSHVMNEQGNVENEYLYDAFGNVTASAENVPNRFCYTGEQYDRIPNQYYLRARNYNPVIGRFTQQDTYLGAGLNLYAYCGGNPLSYVDPSGHTQQSAGDNAQDYTNLPSFQRMMAERKEGENKYIDGQLQVMSNLLDGEKSPQTTALMNVPQPGDLLPVVYQPFDYGALIKTGGDDGKPVATQSTAPDDSYNAVPFRNDAGTDSGTNPLDTAQRSAVAEAVSDAGGGEISGGTTYKNSSDITKEIRKNKPLYSPNIDKWYNNNGTISIDENGVWTYHDWKGNSVSYPDGYPDFKSAGMVKQEVNIGTFQGYNVDFPKGDEMAPNGPISANSTWHHHQDGVTFQEVLTKYHERFRHRGGMSKIKE